jgi:hypothetical protein
MPRLPEPAAAPGREGSRRTVAFGLPLEIDGGIEVPGLAPEPPAPVPGREAPTAIALDPEGLERRWAGAEGEARRMRELRGGGETLLTVDLREPAGYLLEARDVGRVLVSPDGGEILCAPLPQAPEWAFILAAQALPLAATLRGLEVFHAAGVVVEGQAVLFAGQPGAGKSSLAAAFLRREAGLLGDDAIALELRDGAIVAHPSAATVYLRPVEHERLSAAERDRLGGSVAFASRRRYAPGTVPGPAPLAAFFLLERAGGGAAIEPVPAVDPFALLASTFNLSVRTPERLVHQLDVAAAIADAGAVHRLRVHPGVDADQLAGTVEEHLLAAVG